jgi:DNA-binding transcriptional ArsR family regulator
MCIYTAVSGTFQVLADPTRRRIVEVLKERARSVNEITGMVGIKQSGVSRHLRILQESGFVAEAPRAQEHIYSLRSAPFRELDAWLSGYRSLWEGRLDRLGEELSRQREARRKK